MNALLYLKTLGYIAITERLVVVFMVIIIMVFPQELPLFNCLKFFLILAFTQLLFWYLLRRLCEGAPPHCLAHTLHQERALSRARPFVLISCLRSQIQLPVSALVL